MQSAISLSVDEIHQLIDQHKKILFVDVREQWERDLNNIEGSTHLPMGIIGQYDLALLKPEQYDYVIVYCQHGVRSTKAAYYFREKLIGNAFSMKDGITAWLY